MGLSFLGEPLKRGSLKCQRCGINRDSRTCPKCGYDAVLIRLNWQGKTYRYYHDHEGKAFSFSEGLITLRKINHEIDSRTFNPVHYLKTTIQEMKFKTAFNAWLEVKELKALEGHIKKETIRLYRSYYRNHFQPLYDLDVREITDLEEVFRRNRKPKEPLFAGLKLNYQRRLFECLKSFFNHLAAKRKILPAQIPIFPEITGDDARPRRAITYIQQVEAILRIPPAHRDIFWFMRETACREGEASVVKAGDLDFNPERVLIQRTLSKNEISETTKQKKKQTVPLSPRAMEICRRNRKDKLPGAWLFTHGQGKYYSVEYLRKIWRKYSGCELTLYEGMRHSTISDWALTGSAFEVQLAARHTDQRTTQKYVHEVGDSLLRLVSKHEVADK